MNKIKNYANFIKVEHSLFSLPLILSGAILAESSIPDLKVLILITIAGIGARTAALAINRILDSYIDSMNPRTKNRELPSGKINQLEAYLIAGTGICIYLTSAYLICELVFLLSPIPIAAFIFYPLMKRFTPFCHFGVGLGLALGPLGGWLAVTCSLNSLFTPITLALFTLLWVAGFDIIYATLDEKFDKENKIYSIISMYGKRKGLFISALLHLFAFLSLVIVYLIEFKSLVSLFVLFITGYFLYIEHKKSENVDLAFFKINIVIGFMVFIFVLTGIYLP